jgi:acetylglutamate kinase
MPNRVREAMAEYIQRAAVLVEALPYIREFDGKTVVIKYGGAAMTDPALRRSTAEDIVLMRYVGMNPVVVHGGGPAINERLKQLNVEAKFQDGLRVTDDETMGVVEMVLAGTINKEVVSLINVAGGTAVGICGKDGNLLHAQRIDTDSGADLGRVGKIVGLHYRIINVLCEAGMIPVIAPVATDPEGGTWNVNADTAAGEVAAALSAEKLIFLTDTPGILREQSDPESLLHQLDYEGIRQLTAEGIIAGGMLPKVEACLKALDYGVMKTHIVDGRVPHALLLELFTDTGLGTLLTH